MTQTTYKDCSNMSVKEFLLSVNDILKSSKQLNEDIAAFCKVNNLNFQWLTPSLLQIETITRYTAQPGSFFRFNI